MKLSALDRAIQRIDAKIEVLALARLELISQQLPKTGVKAKPKASRLPRFPAVAEKDEQSA